MQTAAITLVENVSSHCKIDNSRYRIVRRSKDVKGNYYYVDRLWQLRSGRLIAILNYVGNEEK